MASKKIYYNTDDSSMGELQAFRNAEGCLFLSVTDTKTQEGEYLLLPEDEAIELIADLIDEFGLIDETEYMEGRMTLKSSVPIK